MRTTPPPGHRVAELFPELAGTERVTVRLHPRRGPEPAPDATKLGGHIRWPVDEAWPRCHLPHADYGANAGPAFARPPDDRPYVAVLQLRRSDVPELGFPPEADLFQLLWCPASHLDPLYVAAVRVFWRRSADLADVIAPAPEPSLDADDYVPRPCVLYPERVVEYPDIGELEEVVQDRISAWEEAEGDDPL